MIPHVPVGPLGNQPLAPIFDQFTGANIQPFPDNYLDCRYLIMEKRLAQDDQVDEVPQSSLILVEFS